MTHIPIDSYENIRDNYVSSLKWMKSIGVKITSGRTKFYEQIIDTWTRDFRAASVDQANAIALDFISSLFEVMDFIDIYNSFKSAPQENLKSIAYKLQKGVNGPINLKDETSTSTTARNFIFEALVAARGHNPERSVYSNFDALSDTGLIIDEKHIWIECKRLSSEDKLEANARKACDQIESVMRHQISTQHRGLVAIDFTKIVNSGDKILVQKNDKDLVQALESLSSAIFRKHSRRLNSIYEDKNKKIMGTLIRFSTMAKSEGSNLMVRANQWSIFPKQTISAADENLLYKLVASMQ